MADMGDNTVTLSDMAHRLNDELGLDIAPMSPYAWWRRHRVNDLPVPMPEVEFWIGQRSPVWRWDRILRWYKAWKGLG